MSRRTPLVCLIVAILAGCGGNGSPVLETPRAGAVPAAGSTPATPSREPVAVGWPAAPEETARPTDAWDGELRPEQRAFAQQAVDHLRAAYPDARFEPGSGFQIRILRENNKPIGIGLSGLFEAHQAGKAGEAGDAFFQEKLIPTIGKLLERH